MGESFGVIPLSNLRVYEGPEIKSSVFFSISTKNTILCGYEENHASAKQFSYHVETDIQEEIKHGPCLGLFGMSP